MYRGNNLPERLKLIRKYIQALHCPTRWQIIDAIGSGEKSTKEIYEELKLGEAGMTFAGLTTISLLSSKLESSNWLPTGK